jgi:uncharacterized protein (DUF1499 family)
LADGRLAPCPAAPNCVSSDALDPGHAVAPLRFTGDPALAWKAARAACAELPRTTIVQVTDTALRAESRSAIFRFVDDVELVLRRADRSISVRSAARVGYYDMGANRRRVSKLRSLIRDYGEPASD